MVEERQIVASHIARSRILDVASVRIHDLIESQSPVSPNGSVARHALFRRSP